MVCPSMVALQTGKWLHLLVWIRYGDYGRSWRLVAQEDDSRIRQLRRGWDGRYWTDKRPVARLGLVGREM